MTHPLVRSLEEWLQHSNHLCFLAQQTFATRNVFLFCYFFSCFCFCFCLVFVFLVGAMGSSWCTFLGWGFSSWAMYINTTPYVYNTHFILFMQNHHMLACLMGTYWELVGNPLGTWREHAGNKGKMKKILPPAPTENY